MLQIILTVAQVTSAMLLFVAIVMLLRVRRQQRLLERLMAELQEKLDDARVRFESWGNR